MDEKDLIQAIMEAGLDIGAEDEGGALTTGEISEASGMAVRVVRELLKPLMSQGYVEAIYVLRETLRSQLTGKLVKVPGYRLTKEGKKALGDTFIKA